MPGSTTFEQADRPILPPHAKSEDELDWLENQGRSADDQRRVDKAFLSGWLGLTAMWIALAIVGSGAIGAVRVIAALAHH